MQTLPKERQIFLEIAEDVNESLTNPPANVTNITEWAKRDLCWKAIDDLEIQLTQDARNSLISPEKSNERERGC